MLAALAPLRQLSENILFSSSDLLPLAIQLLSLAMRVTCISLPNFPLQVVESNDTAPPNWMFQAPGRRRRPRMEALQYLGIIQVFSFSQPVPTLPPLPRWWWGQWTTRSGSLTTTTSSSCCWGPPSTSSLRISEDISLTNPLAGPFHISIGTMGLKQCAVICDSGFKK